MTENKALKIISWEISKLPEESELREALYIATEAIGYYKKHNKEIIIKNKNSDISKCPICHHTYEKESDTYRKLFNNTL